MLNKFRINKEFFSRFLCFSLYFILVYIISLALYISMPGICKYSAVVFERGVLMLEYIVCAFTAAVVFLFAGAYFKKK